MHDIERGGNTTARRLAALAALRNAQGEAADGDENDGRSAGQRRTPGRPKGAAPRDETEHPAASRLGGEMSSGVYAAVEAAVQRSRVEFLARLGDYRQKLDCDAFSTPGSDARIQALDEAQFVAHRIAGLGKTLGFADLGDTARSAEAAITAYKLERTTELRQTAISRICKLSGMIEATCAEHGHCTA